MKRSIKVPCSSANLGPGFDVFGLALKASSVPFGPQRFSAVLEVQVEELSCSITAPLNCEIECEGEGSDSISLDVDKKYGVGYVNRHETKLMLLVSLRGLVSMFYVAMGYMPSRSVSVYTCEYVSNPKRQGTYESTYMQWSSLIQRAWKFSRRGGRRRFAGQRGGMSEVIQGENVRLLSDG